MRAYESKSKVYSKWHLEIMVLCCLILIAILIAVVYANVESPYLLLLTILFLSSFRNPFATKLTMFLNQYTWVISGARIIKPNMSFRR